VKVTTMSYALDIDIDIDIDVDKDRDYYNKYSLSAVKRLN